MQEICKLLRRGKQPVYIVTNNAPAKVLDAVHFPKGTDLKVIITVVGNILAKHPEEKVFCKYIEEGENLNIIFTNCPLPDGELNLGEGDRYVAYDHFSWFLNKTTIGGVIK